MDPSGLPAEDAEDVAMMLARTGRAVDPAKWVEAWIKAAVEAETNQSLASVL